MTAAPHEAARRAMDATGDWEMAVEAALVAARMNDELAKVAALIGTWREKLRKLEAVHPPTGDAVGAAMRSVEMGVMREVITGLAAAIGLDQEATPATDDPFGGHEFAYESHTDLFRCVRCHMYEVTARKEEGPIKPCTGQPPAGAQPIEVNAW